jgi:ABC-type bacteriocin/lantibiotic exporter with double-glycine peptidase domain
MDKYNEFWKDNECNIISDPLKLPFPSVLTIQHVDFHRLETNYHLTCDHEIVIPIGSVVKLCGDTASGKSTLCDLLLGRDILKDGDKSAITLLEGEPRQFNHHMCECGQDTSTRLNWSISTVRQHFNSEPSDELIQYFCNITCIKEKVMSIGFDTGINRAVSGGEQQRITLASNLHYAYQNKSRVLIFDEPEKGLGKLAEQVLKNIVDMEESKNAIIIMSTHHPSSAGYTHILNLVKTGNTTEISSLLT